MKIKRLIISGVVVSVIIVLSFSFTFSPPTSPEPDFDRLSEYQLRSIFVPIKCSCSNIQHPQFWYGTKQFCWLFWFTDINQISEDEKNNIQFSAFVYGKSSKKPYTVNLITPVDESKRIMFSIDIAEYPEVCRETSLDVYLFDENELLSSAFFTVP